MSRLEEILQKHEDQKEFHFHEIDKITIIYPAVREYAKEVAQASLEKAYFNHEIFTRNGHDEEIIELNKESITNPENIILL